MITFRYGLALPWLNPVDLNEAEGNMERQPVFDLLKRGLPCLNPLDLNEANFSRQIPDFEAKSSPRLNPVDLSKAGLSSAGQNRFSRHISLCLV